jgi:hypothetical protein
MHRHTDINTYIHTYIPTDKLTHVPKRRSVFPGAEKVRAKVLPLLALSVATQPLPTAVRRVPAPLFREIDEGAKHHNGNHAEETYKGVGVGWTEENKNDKNDKKRRIRTQRQRFGAGGNGE